MQGEEPLKSLFEEFKIRNTVIKNRICVPPMVCYNYSDDSGKVAEKNVIHYGHIANGGFGFVVIEATAISKDGRLAFDQLGLWEDEQIEGHSKIVEKLHEQDIPVVVQIHHAGVMGCEEKLVSSSDYTLGEKFARELTIDEIKVIENKFVDTAVRAEKAGYDGVELHGAHSYLLTQFLSSRVNKRTDEYGQDKTLIVKNITKKIRENTSENFIVGIRMGAFEPTLDDGIEHAKVFEEIGLDFLNISYGVRFDMDDFAPNGYEFSHAVYGAGEIRKYVSVPVFAANEITNKKQAENILSQTDADMVCIGRGVLVNYNWANDAKNDKDVGKCLYCKNCYWRTPMADCAGRMIYHKNKTK